MGECGEEEGFFGITRTTTELKARTYQFQYSEKYQIDHTFKLNNFTFKLNLLIQNNVDNQILISNSSRY